ncbi:MAG: replication-associated recombination protein A [Pseudomonadota bacterium]
MDLFEQAGRQAVAAERPLAERMRPKALDDFIGQQAVVGPGAVIRTAIENDRIFSMIFWGPPGCGKTTLARIIAGETRAHVVAFSAVLSGVKEIRSVVADAKQQLHHHHRRTILFVDEIHRFNKAQQDAFLHHVESGLITLIGATTENPSFEVIPALMSRCRVIVLEPLSSEDMRAVLQRAVDDRRNGIGGRGLTFSIEALDHLVAMADGDLRYALNSLEIVADMSVAGPLSAVDAPAEAGPPVAITLEDVERALQRKAVRYDKSGEEHYNLISALHKSMRGSDPDAAVYWLTRMLAAGEDPRYIARRMIRFASEDVGNADPYALTLTMDALAAYRLLGTPEGELALVQAAVYLATAPKSNRTYNAYQRAKILVERTGAQPVPLHIRNAPTRLMKTLDYGKGYQYDPDCDDGYSGQRYMPEALTHETIYEPSDFGYEKKIRQRMAHWKEARRRRRSLNSHEGQR